MMLSKASVAETIRTPKYSAPHELFLCLLNMIDNFVNKFVQYVESGYLSSHEIATLTEILPFIKEKHQSSIIKKIIDNKGMVKLSNIDHEILQSLFFNTDVLKHLQRAHSKTPKTFAEQVQLLKDRNLSINDDNQTELILSRLSYYHLRGYFLLFETEHILHEGNKFVDKTSFDDIYQLYLFDTKLQEHLFASFKDIEVYLRTTLIYELAVKRNICTRLKSYVGNWQKISFSKTEKSKLEDLIIGFPDYKDVLSKLKNNGLLFTDENKQKFLTILHDKEFIQKAKDSHPYLNCNNFKDLTTHKKSLSKLIDDLGKSTEIFINHYYLFYNIPEHPPIWSAFEVLTFDQTSWWINNLKPVDGRIIFEELGIADGVMKKLIRTLVVVRNIISHHGRLVYRNIPYFDVLPENIILDSLFIRKDKTSFSKRLFNLLLIISYMMNKINNNNEWTTQLIHILSSATNKQRYTVGCPQDWQQRLLKL
jgi:abortive infection bacteriophage resistance protein